MTSRDELIQTFKSKASEWDSCAFDPDWDYSTEAAILADIALAAVSAERDKATAAGERILADALKVSAERDRLHKAITEALAIHDAWGTPDDPDGKTRPVSDYTELSARMAAELRSAAVGPTPREAVQGEPSNVTDPEKTNIPGGEMSHSGHSVQGEP